MTVRRRAQSSILCRHVDLKTVHYRRVPLAPDYNHKYFVSGGGPYEITTPCPAIDAPFEGEWHDTTFVNYLRICLRWAGFPGWERTPVRPERDIAALTAGLLPF